MGCDFFYSGSQNDASKRKACISFVHQVFSKIISDCEAYFVNDTFVQPGSIVVRQTNEHQASTQPLDGPLELLDTRIDTESRPYQGYKTVFEVYRVKKFTCEGIVPLHQSELYARSQFVFETTHGNLITLISDKFNEIGSEHTWKQDYFSKWINQDYLDNAECLMIDPDHCHYREIYNYAAYAEFLKFIQTHYLSNLEVSDDYFEFERVARHNYQHLTAQDMLEYLHYHWTGKHLQRTFLASVAEKMQKPSVRF